MLAVRIASIVNKNEVLVETSSENNKKTREGEKDNSPLYSV